MIAIRGLAFTAYLSTVFARGCRAKIQWNSCNGTEFQTDFPVECGSVSTPLDYTDSNSTTFQLEIVKIPATAEKSKGSILLNFGGPGLESRQTLVLLGSLLQTLSGGEYDLVAFDPRGVGKTLPFICVDNIALEAEMASDSAKPIDSRENIGRLWARGHINSNICKEDPLGVGQYVNTAFTARDFMSVVDGLGEDGMLRYWGFSYGTTLGATLASMFPERIDRMIIDGVQNPHEYYNAFADFEEWTDSDKALRTMLEACIDAGADSCILASRNETTIELEKGVYNLFNDLRYDPVPVGLIIIDHFLVQAVVAECLKSIHSWPLSIALLDALFRRDIPSLEVLMQILLSEVGEPPSSGRVRPLQGLENNWAIHCSDRALRATSLDEVRPTFEKLLKTSRLFGLVTGWKTTVCAQWMIEPKERYAGDFKVKTENPVLVIGNTVDAHTPLRSAYNVSSGFDGSVVLEVNGTGHCSINLPSVCTAQHTMQYWLDGTLPKVGTVCDVDALPFTNTTWADVFAKMGADRRSMHDRVGLEEPRGFFVQRRWL